MVKNDNLFEQKEKILNYLAFTPNCSRYQISKNLGLSYSTLFEHVNYLIQNGFVQNISKSNIILTEKGLLYVLTNSNFNGKNFLKIIENYKTLFFIELFNSKIFNPENIEDLITFLKNAAKTTLSFLKFISEKEEKEMITSIFYYSCFTHFLLNYKIKEKLRKDKKFMKLMKEVLSVFKQAGFLFQSFFEILERSLKEDLREDIKKFLIESLDLAFVTFYLRFAPKYYSINITKNEKRELVSFLKLEKDFIQSLKNLK